MQDRILRLNRVVFHPCVYQQPFFQEWDEFHYQAQNLPSLFFLSTNITHRHC